MGRVSWGAAGAAGFYGALAALAWLGARDVLSVYEENRCSMTYMFEYPEYLKIKLPKTILRRYPAYELYLYGEGSYAEENRNLVLTGIPVLFLPGNAGSYKQVRSLGSIALRKAEDLDFKHHFDVFSVNFNEELVALYGGSLQRQTRFVHECIKIILKLYKGRDSAPSSVAIVGHSMGGLVARALLTLKNFKAELINILVTQATPHIAPVMPLDQYLTDFYTAVNHHWNLKARDRANLTTLSVAGGFRDYQVHSGLALLPRSSRQDSALSVVSSEVPQVWASTDHLSIVWCKELILATVRAFFDLIDEDTKQITQDPQKRMLVLEHHFLKHPAKFFEEKPELFAELAGALIGIPVKTSKWSYTAHNESDGKYFTFPSRITGSHTVTFTVKTVCCFGAVIQASWILRAAANGLEKSRGKASNLAVDFAVFQHKDTNSWVYGCTNDSSSACLQGVDLSWKAELLPTVKTVTLKLQDYPSLTHLVLHVPAVNSNKFTLDCEFFNEASRTVELPVTHLFSFGLSSSKIVLNSTGLIHNVQLQHFGQIYQAFKLSVESHCQSLKERKPSVYRLHIPWSHEDSFTLSQVPSTTEISAKLHVAQPENDTTVPVLNIYSSPDCQYEVTIRTSFPQVLGQVIRFHGGTLPVYIISNILLAYGRQLKSLISTGHCSDFILALTKASRPYKVEPLVNILKFLLGLNWFRGLWGALSLPELDVATLSKRNMWFPFVSLVLFMFGTGIAYWGAILSSSSIKLLSSLWVALSRPSGAPREDKLVTRRRLSVAAFVLFLGWTTCGALAIVITYFHYIFKVIKLHSSVQTELSVLNMHSERTSENSHKETGKSRGLADGNSETAEPPARNTATAESVADSLKMHFTVLNMLTWIVLLSCPSLIYWLKNLRYHIKLDPDPCRTVSFILVTVVGIIMNANITKIKSSKLLKIAAYAPLPLSVAVVAFTPMHLYRISHLVLIPLSLHAFCCIV